MGHTAGDTAAHHGLGPTLLWVVLSFLVVLSLQWEGRSAAWTEDRQAPVLFPVKIITRREAQNSSQAGSVLGCEQPRFSSFLELRVGRILLRWRQPVGRGSTLLLGCLHTSPQPESLVAFGEEHSPHSRRQQESWEITAPEQPCLRSFRLQFCCALLQLLWKQLGQKQEGTSILRWAGSRQPAPGSRPAVWGMSREKAPQAHLQAKDYLGLGTRPQVTV